MAEFVMPILGADMEDGTLVEWRKRPGEPVRRGDIVAEVETDKGLIEVEAFVDGVLEQILVPPGAKVPVGTVLARIREEGATTQATVSAATASSAGTGGSGSDVAPARPVPAPGSPGMLVQARETAGASAAGARGRISPAARRRASELGVDPAAVRGTGPAGAVQIADVERAAALREATGRREGPAPGTTGRELPGERPSASPAGAPAAQIEVPAEASPALRAGRPDLAERLARMRQTIAAAMARSKREIPHYYLSTQIDMHAALAWLTAANLDRPVGERLLPGVLLLRAVALALREVPELNGHWVDGHAERSSAVHLGVAISLRGGGLVAPAIQSADEIGVDELMHRLRDLVQRARAGTLRSSELSSPTITVTNLGDQGVETVFGVIYPPQVAIVGFGKVVERPWSLGSEIVSCPVVTGTLSGDHRASDGHQGARFLATIDRLLQKPEAL